jgi:hypothetical protein
MTQQAWQKNSVSIALGLGLTQKIVAVSEYFTVNEEVTRTDLHRGDHNNRTATRTGRTAVGAPEMNQRLPSLQSH